MRTSISIRSYDGGQSRHSHPHHQVILPLAGKMRFETGRGTGLVDGLQGAMVAAGEPHAFAGLGRNRFLILDVTDPRDETLWDAASHDGFFALGTAVRGLLQYAGTAGPRAAEDPLRGPALAGLLLHGLESQVVGGAEAEPAQLRRALALIHRDYGKPLTVETIARHAGASASTLTRLFRDHIGRAPAAYLAEHRISRARELLEATPRSIADIALSCGYGDQAALTRAFRRTLDVTPAALRRRLRQRSAGI